VATGQDRRLGDYMTVALDPNGCEMIATGDVTQTDPLTGGQRQTALPLFIHQSSGASLTGGTCGSASPAAESPFAQGPGGVTASCVDRSAPRSRIRGRVVRRERVVLRGTAGDSGCRNAQAATTVPGRVRAVDVSVARLAGGRCAFVRRNGTLTAPRSCAHPLYLRARGTGHWTLSTHRELPDGDYVIRTRALDFHGNAERPRSTGNVRRFRVT
jgi:hypothetical protein